MADVKCEYVYNIMCGIHKMSLFFLKELSGLLKRYLKNLS